MRISRQIVDSMKPSSLGELREKNKLEQTLEKAENTCLYVETVAGRIKESDNDSSIDGDPRLHFVMTSREAKFGDPKNIWNLSSPFFCQIDHREEVVAEFSGEQRAVQAKAKGHGYSIGLEDKAGADGVVYRTTANSSPTKVVKHVGEDGETSYDIYEGTFRVCANDWFGL